VSDQLYTPATLPPGTVYTCIMICEHGESFKTMIIPGYQNEIVDEQSSVPGWGHSVDAMAKQVFTHRSE